MSITRSVEGIAEFMEENDELIKDLVEAGEATAKELDKLSTRLETARADAEDLVRTLGKTKFAVEKDADLGSLQQKLLQEIGDNGKKIMMFVDEPELVGLFHAQRSKLYLALANTYDATVQKIVTFSQGDVDEIQRLLDRAVLDTAKRKKKAAILDGAIGLTKIALKVGMKVATA